MFKQENGKICLVCGTTFPLDQECCGWQSLAQLLVGLCALCVVFVAHAVRSESMLMQDSNGVGDSFDPIKTSTGLRDGSGRLDS